MIDKSLIRDFPPMTATLLPNHTGVFRVGTAEQHVAEADENGAMRALVDLMRAEATKSSRPIRVMVTDPTSMTQLVVGVDGSLEEETQTDYADTEPAPTAEPVAPAPVIPAAPVAPTPAVETVERVEVPTMISEPAAPVQEPAGPGMASVPAPIEELPISERRAARQSFLTQEQVEEPATQGIRGLLATVGIRVAPSEAERQEREWARLVSQHWPGPRTVLVANGKGGVGKTLASICLSGVFARYGGAGVLAWDNNQTRGTLGWSTEQGPHDSTILELLPQVSQLLGTGAQSADLARYVHHQTRDRYDVLRSKPTALADAQRFDGETVDQIHAVASKFYRLVFIDTGNDETDPMWLRAVERANQLVVPTTTQRKSAESAALLLEGLAERGGHFAHLADNAVVVVTKHNADVADADVAEIAGKFRALARAVVTVPYDKALAADIINYGSLQPSTQRAWLTAGAAVAEGL